MRLQRLDRTYEELKPEGVHYQRRRGAGSLDRTYEELKPNPGRVLYPGYPQFGSYL